MRFSGGGVTNVLMQIVLILSQPKQYLDDRQVYKYWLILFRKIKMAAPSRDLKSVAREDVRVRLPPLGTSSFSYRLESVQC